MSKLDYLLKSVGEEEEEPNTGHLERFHRKLHQQNKKIRIGVILEMTGVVILIFLSTYLVRMNINPKDQSFSKNEKEIEEAETYYSRQINREVSEVDQLVKQGVGSEKDLIEMRKEFMEMDNYFVNLEKDYKTNPQNERLQSAVIQYYQSKLEIVNIVKNELENVKLQKLKYHEINKI